MSRSTDRSQDPSPFAWILGGALAMIAAGSVIRAVTGRRGSGGQDVAGGRDAGDADADLAGHPS
ncbi:hypothetical protein BJF81_14970 [Ornithinimicrobium sp. CNJ-824]|uniref:hypothetical protein n=1 Tax=Ornithinimicrobium sp. CNJ-824 TaxID=1904966 RepID=UPI00095B8FAE|nr:hypothetical protein [Ornithinimicrobium sp. CNJ-824]OLT21750.1 hypothetical protein BJF81_14970 [Ornithinimicrobium sp. CNJ-824]